MKAIAAPSYGPLEHLTAIDVPVPMPGAGEVRVRVVASALSTIAVRDLSLGLTQLRKAGGRVSVRVANGF